jgi:nitrogen fixation protein NifB
MSNTAFVSIGDLQRGRPGRQQILETAASGGCGTTGGEGKASCGSSDGPDDMPAEIWEKVKNHPCYSEEAHHHYARMHVAVAPACNIQCNYCNRKYDCSNEAAPAWSARSSRPSRR